MCLSIALISGAPVAAVACAYQRLFERGGPAAYRCAHDAQRDAIGCLLGSRPRRRRRRRERLHAAGAHRGAASEIIDGDSFEIGGDGRAPVRRRRARRPPILHARRPRMGAAATRPRAELRRLIGSRAVTLRAARRGQLRPHRRRVPRRHRRISAPRWCAPGSRWRIAVTATTTSTRNARRSAARRGIWAGEFTRARGVSARRTAGGRARRRARSPRRRRARDGCYIKGNINGEGERIYHMPDSPSYDETRDRREPRRALVLHRGRSEERRLARAARLTRCGGRSPSPQQTHSRYA